jgi:polyphosphate kinase 2 (PPK2 family)
VIIIGGVDGAGKGETLNLLNEWMDPRHIQTNAMRPVGDGLEGRPPMWRFWRALPPNGRIAVFVGSWYSMPLIKRVYGEIKTAKLDQQIDDILRFERMLACCSSSGSTCRGRARRSGSSSSRAAPRPPGA